MNAISAPGLRISGTKVEGYVPEVGPAPDLQPAWGPADLAITWPLTSGGDMAFQPDGVANSALLIFNTSAIPATNGLAITGRASTTPNGTAPSITAWTTEVLTDLGIDFSGLGLGPLRLGSANNQGGQVLLGGRTLDLAVGTAPLSVVPSGGNPVNGITVTGALSGATPAIGASGGDTNVALNLVTQGSGALQINGAAGSSGQVLTSGGAAAAPTWQDGGVTAPLTLTGTNDTTVLTLNGFASQISTIAVVTDEGTPILYVNPSGSAGLGQSTVAISALLGTNYPLLVSSAVNPNNGSFIVGNHGQVIIETDPSATDAPLTINRPGGGGALLAVAVASASAVNGLTISGQVTGVSPTIAATGSDTNIGLAISGKGSGSISLNAATNANLALTSTNVTLATNAATGALNFKMGTSFALAVTGGVVGGVNYITMLTNQATGNGVTIQPSGGDTNIAMSLNSLGTGNLILQGGAAAGSALLGGNATQTAGRSALTATGVASGVNGLTVTQAATTAAPSLAATGSDTNIALNLVTKGSGALQINGAAGTSGQVLTSGGASAVPTWSTPTGASLSWPLTFTGDMGFQPNSVASSALILHNNASAVNGITVTGVGAGAPPTITATGSDTNIGLTVSSKGTGTTIVQGSSAILQGVSGSVSAGSSSGTNAVFFVGALASSGAALQLMPLNNQTTQIGTLRIGVAYPVLTVDPNGLTPANGVTITGANGGNTPSLATTGTDTNIALNLVTKGTGALQINGAAGSAGNVLTSNGASAAPTWAAPAAPSFPLNGVSTSATAFTVAAAGANYGLQVDESTASAVTGLKITPAGTGAGLALSVISSGANEALTLVSKGTGNVSVYTTGSDTGSVLLGGAQSPTTVGQAALTATGAASGVNGLTVTQAAAAAAPTLAATGSDTNIGLTLQAKGTGTVVLQAGSTTYTFNTSNKITTNGNPLAIQGSGTTGQVTMGGSAGIGTAGQAALTATGVASGVNGITVTQAATTAAPSLSATGSDTNIGLTLVSKGTGNVSVYTAGSDTGSVLLGGAQSPTTVGQAALTATGVASGVNGVTVTQTATTGSPTIAASGSDSNITLIVQSKGTGTLLLRANGAGNVQLYANNTTGQVLIGGSASFSTAGRSALTATGVASGVNGITVTQAATTAAPSLAATGSDTNIGLTLVSKGTGNVSVYTTGSDTGSVLLGGAQSPTTVGQAALSATGVASGVNGLTVTQAATGTGPIIAATGSDTNIAVTINAKGSGNINIGASGTGTLTVSRATTFQNGLTLNAGVTIAMASGAMSLLSGATTGSVQLQNSSGSNVLIATGVASTANQLTVTSAVASSPPILSATGSDTNIDLRLTPKGSGLVDLNVSTVALGSTTPAVNGNIGGSGPATSTQNSWLPVKVAGTTSYIPIWR